MTTACDIGHLEACFCDSNLAAKDSHLSGPVEAQMPDLTPARTKAGSHLLTVVLAVAAVLIVAVYVGLPMVLAVDHAIKSLPGAIMIGVGTLVVAAVLVLLILRSTAKAKALSHHRKGGPALKRLAEVSATR